MKTFLHSAFALILSLFASSPLIGIDAQMVTTDTMRKETYYVVQCLENIHYNNQSIQKLDMNQVVEEYVTQYDMHHLFFLQKEVDQFKTRFAPTLELYLRQGNTFPAFEIFTNFLDVANERFDWVDHRLDESFDFTIEDYYTPDRRKLPWPADHKAASHLWEQRIKYELLNELLGQKQLVTNFGIWEIVELPNDKGEWKPAYVYPGYHLNALEAIQPRNELLVLLENGDRFSNMKQWLTQAQDHALSFSQKLSVARESVKKHYQLIRKILNELEPSEIHEIFITTVAGMYDPHSNFLSSDTLQEFSIAIQNALVGIGAVLTEEEGYTTIRELLPGGPAEKSKLLHANDKIVAVGQDNEPMKDVVGMKLRKVVRLIRGQEGTKVNLLIQPADRDPSSRLEITLTREEIKLTANLAKAYLYEVPATQNPNNKIRVGVIDLPTFYGGTGDADVDANSTTRHVLELIDKLKKEQVQGIVIDLRRNSGGLLPEVIALSGIFVGAGPVLQVRDTEGRIIQYNNKDAQMSYDGPLIVMETRYSASASEILTGALKNYQRALIIGDPNTHGKGTVQVVLELDRAFQQIQEITPKMGAAKITVQKWYLPNGNSIQVKGVAADIVIPSANVYLPIGESDLPHALPWDSIAPLTIQPFESSYKIDEVMIAKLKDASLHRQKTLPEFEVLNKNISWIKAKEEQKNIPLKLDERQATLFKDQLLREQVEAELKTFPKDEYRTKEILLDVALSEQTPKDLRGESSEPSYDFDLGESLRIMRDWIEAVGPLPSTDSSPDASAIALK
jgi:carboxyl-terminal processing protease